MSNINAIIFIILYVLVALIGWEGLFNFDYATPESWYSRSGALLTLIGLYSEIKILPQVSMLADESQNEKYAMISLMITKGYSSHTWNYCVGLW